MSSLQTHFYLFLTIRSVRSGTIMSRYFCAVILCIRMDIHLFFTSVCSCHNSWIITLHSVYPDEYALADNAKRHNSGCAILAQIFLSMYLHATFRRDQQPGEGDRKVLCSKIKWTTFAAWKQYQQSL